jgi:hypothetical protein
MGISKLAGPSILAGLLLAATLSGRAKTDIPPHGKAVILSRHLQGSTETRSSRFGGTTSDHSVVGSSFREDGILDRAADAEGKGQLAVHQFASGQTAKSIGEEALLSCDLRGAAIVERV